MTFRGIDLCERYFQSTFDEGQDAIAFCWKYHSSHSVLGDHIWGVRVKYETYDHDPMQGGYPESLPAYEGSTQLMPAWVGVQSNTPRRDLYKHPHYFGLVWMKSGVVIAALRIDPNADGLHDKARLHIVDGRIQISVTKNRLVTLSR